MIAVVLPRFKCVFLHCRLYLHACKCRYERRKHMTKKDS